jgi:TetR/AcrR family transcriptional repressor of nem operon
MQAQTSTAREKLLDAAISMMRVKGFSATSVDELCAYAGVTKGALFHHFASKEALGVAAADHWSATTGGFFAEAPYHAHNDPLQRVLAYIDFRRAILDGELPDITCFAGTVVQETYRSAPAIREACRAAIFDHAERLEADIAEAMAERSLSGFSARSLALHTQAVLQGAFIIAKAGNDIGHAKDSLDHLKRYVTLLFASREMKSAQEVET